MLQNTGIDQIDIRVLRIRVLRNSLGSRVTYGTNMEQALYLCDALGFSLDSWTKSLFCLVHFHFQVIPSKMQCNVK